MYGTLLTVGFQGTAGEAGTRLMGAPTVLHPKTINSPTVVKDLAPGMDSKVRHFCFLK